MNSAQFLCQIRAEEGSDEAEVLIYDDIGASFFGSGLTAKQFVKDLADIDATLITVRINSAGGDVFDGLAIYNALRRHDAAVTTEIDGLAASIASIIALAGDEVRMADNAFLMIHDPWGMEIGNADDMREMADLLDKVGGSLAGVYAERTGQDKAQIQEWMNAETWFDADEALEAGFVDSLTEAKKMAARADLSAFRNTPKTLRAAVEATTEPEPTPEDIPAPVGGTEPDDSPPPTQPAPAAKGDTMSDQDTAAQTNGAEAERKRSSNIRALVREYSDIVAIEQSKVDKWLDSPETSPADVKDSILAEIKAKASTTPDVSARVGAPRAVNDPKRGFESHRDFLLAVIKNRGRSPDSVRDERLKPLMQRDSNDDQAGGELAFLLPRAYNPRSIMAAAGSDEQGEYADPYGGFLVPETTLPGLLTTPADPDPTAGRTQPLPMASPTVKINARVDKDHSTSVSGGLVMTRRPETIDFSSSRMSFEQISLHATSLAGLGFASEEIMSDSPISFAALLATGFRDQFPAHMANEKIRGVGGSEYLGVLNSPAEIEVAKESGQAADSIVAENIINMRARCWGYGNAIWIANHDAYPQLIKMAVVVSEVFGSDTAAAGGLVTIYQPSMREDRPDMLLGRPIFYSEFASTVGDVGDIILGNWSQYLDGLYQPLQSAESVHVRFVEHERTFKFWVRNAGAPWWRSALTPAESSDTLSPFVTIAERT